MGDGREQGSVSNFRDNHSAGTRISVLVLTLLDVTISPNLMTTLVEHVRVNRHGVRGTPVLLLAIPPDGAGPQDVLLLGPPDRYRVLRALAILMPYLGDCLGVLL